MRFVFKKNLVKDSREKFVWKLRGLTGDNLKAVDLFELVAEEQRRAEARGVKFVRLPIVRRTPSVVE